MSPPAAAPCPPCCATRPPAETGLRAEALGQPGARAPMTKAQRRFRSRTISFSTSLSEMLTSDPAGRLHNHNRGRRSTIEVLAGALLATVNAVREPVTAGRWSECG